MGDNSPATPPEGPNWPAIAEIRLSELMATKERMELFQRILANIASPDYGLQGIIEDYGTEAWPQIAEYYRVEVERYKRMAREALATQAAPKPPGQG